MHRREKLLHTFPRKSSLNWAVCKVPQEISSQRNVKFSSLLSLICTHEPGQLTFHWRLLQSSTSVGLKPFSSPYVMDKRNSLSDRNRPISCPPSGDCRGIRGVKPLSWDRFSSRTAALRASQAEYKTVEWRIVQWRKCLCGANERQRIYVTSQVDFFLSRP